MSDRLGLNLRWHQNCSAMLNYHNTPSVHPAIMLIPGQTGWTIFVCKIQLSKSVDSVDVDSFYESGGAVPGFAVTASPGLQPWLWDFGPEGMPLTQGEALMYAGGGTAEGQGVIVVTAYRRPTGMLVANNAGYTGPIRDSIIWDPDYVEGPDTGPTPDSIIWDPDSPTRAVQPAPNSIIWDPDVPHKD